ncbi:MAG: aspartate carbamoyltransferase [Oscillospiraceae bacterium]|nr:aspartate carbamoyltransferase [Oscillospiraceae bacterium]
MRHFIDFSDLSLAEWEGVYRRFEDILAHPADYRDVARGQVMGSLFFEPSTRTNFSFQAAMQRLGGGVFSMSDPSATSVSKGETLSDTIVMCSGYADLLIVRHPREGAAMASSLYSRVPVVNAGDGGHLHPTQTLIDLAAITRRRGSVSGLHIGVCGDLKYGRTAHSLIRALASFPGLSLSLISPRELAIPEYLRMFLRACGQACMETSSLEDTLPHLDVLYMTRIQHERLADPSAYDRLRGVYVLTTDKLSAAKRDLLILHPLPRREEISVEVDRDPRAFYFEQARLGMYVRMALLTHLLEQPRGDLPPPPDSHNHGHNNGHSQGQGQGHSHGRGHPSFVCANPRCIAASERYLPALSDGKRCLYCDN